MKSREQLAEEYASASIWIHDKARLRNAFLAGYDARDKIDTKNRITADDTENRVEIFKREWR